MKRGCRQLVAEAISTVDTVEAATAVKQFRSVGVVFVDVRDLPELIRDGKIPGAVHASRGMLELHADPESPYHKDVFTSGKKIILYSSTGWRSALAAQRLQEMGLNGVSHMGGGMKAWKEADGPVEVVH
jgi:rhodanese-related sulfurtransferase